MSVYWECVGWGWSGRLQGRYGEAYQVFDRLSADGVDEVDEELHDEDDEEERRHGWYHFGQIHCVSSMETNCVDVVPLFLRYRRSF